MTGSTAPETPATATLTTSANPFRGWLPKVNPTSVKASTGWYAESGAS